MQPSYVDVKPLFGETRSLSGDTQSVFRDKMRLFTDNPSGKEHPRRCKKGKKTSIYSCRLVKRGAEEDVSTADKEAQCAKTQLGP